MFSVSILGIPNDENSSFLRGCAEAPPKIRHELWSDANNMWTETGFDLKAEGRLRDYGDLRFDSGRDSWELIETRVDDDYYNNHSNIKAAYTSRAFCMAAMVCSLSSNSMRALFASWWQ